MTDSEFCGAVMLLAAVLIQVFRYLWLCAYERGRCDMLAEVNESLAQVDGARPAMVVIGVKE